MLGVTLIWGNTEFFPRPFLIADDGSRDEQRFKTWARLKGRTPEVWYSAYPDLGVSNVNNSSEIRRGLQGFRRLKGKLRWLRRL